MKITPQEFRKDPKENMRGGKGVTLIEHMVTENLPEKCRLIAKITLEPGCSIGQHVHEKETEYYLMTKGTATVNDNGKIVECKAGDVIVTPDGYGHSIENTGNETMEMIAVIILD